MGLKDKLKKNFFTRGLYAFLKDKKDKRIFVKKFKYKGKFIDRSKNSDKLLIILAGYKDFLYSAIFSRIEKNLLPDMDVCLISSGKYSEELAALGEKNGWSYLSTKQNNLCLVQNVALKLHPNAKLIFKLDEDIFVTENYFENMLKAYEHAKSGEYSPGILAPMIPINGYAHMRILEKLGLKEVYSEKFERAQYIAGPTRKIENDPEVAKFFWGEGGYVPTIDEMNARFSKEPIAETVCPIRFSIGAILFERALWEDMEYLKVIRGQNQLGDDEAQICSYCCLQSRPVMVSENVVVGHLSFGKQNAVMKEYYLSHKELFTIQK